MDAKVDALGALSVFDVEGNPVPAASLWAERPAVVGFVRHFG